MLVVRIDREGRKLVVFERPCPWIEATTLLTSEVLYVYDRARNCHRFNLDGSYAFLRANGIEVQRQHPVDGTWVICLDADEYFMPRIQGTAPKESRCECGAEKCRTTHSSWCPKAR